MLIEQTLKRQTYILYNVTSVLDIAKRKTCFIMPSYTGSRSTSFTFQFNSIKNFEQRTLIKVPLN